MYKESKYQSRIVFICFIYSIIVSAFHLSTFTAVAGEEQKRSKEIVIKGAGFESVVLNPNHHIVITATGDGPAGSVSEAHIQVMAMPDLVVLSVDTSLAKDNTESWEISPEKNPYTLQVSGKSGQIRLKVDQKP